MCVCVCIQKNNRLVLSHSDNQNLPVTLDNKLSATKKMASAIFVILASKYGITCLFQLPLSSSSFLSINIKAF